MRRFLFSAFALVLALPPFTVHAALPTTRPTAVKLLIEADNPAEGARQITRQLGLAVRLDPSASVVQVDGGGEKPFAAALTELLQQGNLAVSEVTPLTLAHGENYRLVPIGDTAVLVLRGVTVSAQHAMVQGNDSYRYTYELQGNLMLDPALRILGVVYDANAASVEADAPVLAPDSGPGNQPYQLMNAMSGQEGPGRMSIRFSSRTPIGRVTRLTARVRAIQVVEEAAVDVSTDDLSGERVVQGTGISASVSVDNADPRRASLSVNLAGPALDLYRNGQWTQSMARWATMYDVNGELLAADSMGYQPDMNGKNRRLRYRANTNPKFFDELATVKVRVPTKVKLIDIPIEIKDLDVRTK